MKSEVKPPRMMYTKCGLLMERWSHMIEVGGRVISVLLGAYGVSWSRNSELDIESDFLSSWKSAKLLLCLVFSSLSV